MKKIWSLALAACFMILSIAGSSVAAELDDYAGIPKGKWVIGFANDMTGNAWRGQHVAAFKEEAELMKKAGLISKYYISNVDGAAATISGLSDFVAKGVDAICSTATGPAYNSIFQEALDEGIVITTLASAGIKIKPDTKMVLLNNENDELMRAPMEYLSYKMGYKGEIIHLYGLEGGWEGGEVRKAVVREMAANYNMKIVADAPCTWLNSKAYETLTSLLSAHGPAYGGKGILVAGEDVGLGIMQAYQAAKIPFPNIIGDYTYGFLREWAKHPDLVAVGNLYPPSISRSSLHAAVLMLNGYKLDPKKANALGSLHSITSPMPYMIVNEKKLTGKEPWLKNIKSTTKIRLLKDVIAEGEANRYLDSHCADGWLTTKELLDMYYVKK
ncbi:MAG: substrate-binding domain-containing protein [Deltaproteobacteria bacterium]|jgi:ribose transport system substrate-binding protein|nr:substrate-binding domain-containing protein [Deltaproteobacteria bacterium]MBT4644634.1 substrate-binding domain-containing protein [Deltaproteobacteria bacterium]